MSKIRFTATSDDIQIFKKFLDDPNNDNDKLKVQLLGWMWDNLRNINTSNMAENKKKFHEEVFIFLSLIGYPPKLKTPKEK